MVCGLDYGLSFAFLVLLLWRDAFLPEPFVFFVGLV